MTLELFVGLIGSIVLAYGVWALYTVWKVTFPPDWNDTLEEVDTEAQYLEAVRNLSGRSWS